MRRLVLPPSSRSRRGLPLFFLLLLSGVAHLFACDTPTGTASGVVDAEWAIGQATLAPWVGERAYTVWPSMFRWVEQPGAFYCGDVWSNGCFHHESRRIEWNVLTPTVVRHEAMHAILWKLGDSRYQCVEHTEECTP